LQVYESMVIVKPDFEQETLAEFEQGVREVLTENKAEVLRFLNLGLRNLAYEIAEEKRGRYYLIYFQGEGSAVNALSRHLKLTDYAIRHMTINAEGELPKQVEGEAEGIITTEEPFEPRGRGAGRERRAFRRDDEDEDDEERKPARRYKSKGENKKQEIR